MTDAKPEPPPTLNYRPPPRRRPFAISRWIAYPAIALVLLVVLDAVTIPSGHHSRESANRAICASNLRQLGLAVHLYQQDHGGAYPDTLGRLALEETLDAAVFVCRSSNAERSTGATTQAIADDVDAGPEGHHCSYVYVGSGLIGKTATPTTIVAYDAPSNHDGAGGNALYGDGHVEWLTEADAAKLLPAWAAAMHPAR